MDIDPRSDETRRFGGHDEFIGKQTSAAERGISMQHGQPQHITHPRAQRIRAKIEQRAEQDRAEQEQVTQEKGTQATRPVTHSAPERLSMSIQLLNQLLNEQGHRPDAVRLLREILRERAIHQEIKNWDANSLFG
jgi:hypothetical protein